nr:MAG TPA: hypothetical protein [Caudoviricetes sp.]
MKSKKHEKIHSHAFLLIYNDTNSLFTAFLLVVFCPYVHYSFN